jgi:AmmeMemoRadiSam system protein B/AmmeMemoRadiSam system protein A
MESRNTLRRSLLLGLVVVLVACGSVGTAGLQDRDPIGAGQFYPASAAMLKAAVQAMLADALPPRADRPIAIVVPHAGYVYSGQIAADAFRQAAAHRYDTVVIVGTNHTDGGFLKVGICPGRAFRTPLGGVPIDDAFVAALQKEDPDCIVDANVHKAEHSVEVQVPFVQQTLPNAKIVPLVVGRPDPALCARLGRALAAVAKGRSVLLVASSDLSHYPSASDATEVDRRTLETIARLDADAVYQNEMSEGARPVPELVTHACGTGAIMAVIAAARGLGATRGTVISYANSADTIVGEPQRAVGYGAVVFTAGEAGADVAALKAAPRDEGPLQAQDKKWMLAFARETIRRYLATDTLPLPRGFSARLQKNRGVFVTLKERGDLRGCIGHIPSDMPMVRLSGMMAFASAFQDPRFTKVTADEVRDLEVEISVLSPPKPVSGVSDIVVGRDGVVLTADGLSAVFLPQVAPEQGWNRDQMLDNLCLKAGLSANRWRRPGVRFETFQAEVFGERGVK